VREPDWNGKGIKNLRLPVKIGLIRILEVFRDHKEGGRRAALLGLRRGFSASRTENTLPKGRLRSRVYGETDRKGRKEKWGEASYTLQIQRRVRKLRKIIGG